MLAKGCKARLGDALIAQSCVDRGIPLLTCDRDFQAFVGAAGLDLVLEQAKENRVYPKKKIAANGGDNLHTKLPAGPSG